MKTTPIPSGLTGTFEMTVIVDDTGKQLGIVTETNENNNTFYQQINMLPLPSISTFPNVYYATKNSIPQNLI